MSRGRKLTALVLLSVASGWPAVLFISWTSHDGAKLIQASSLQASTALSLGLTQNSFLAAHRINGLLSAPGPQKILPAAIEFMEDLKLHIAPRDNYTSSTAKMAPLVASAEELERRRVCASLPLDQSS